jgi:hypothetical protein
MDMDISRLITYCRRNGIEFALGNGTVRIRGTAGIVEELLPVLRERKSEIIDFLSLEVIQNCERHGLYHESHPFIPEAVVEIARTETQALLSRVMSQRV